MRSFSRYFPWAILALASIYLATVAFRPTPSHDGFDWDAFGRLPVQVGGRVKPLDTLARNSLFCISHKTTYEDEQGRKQPATRWLAEVLFGKQQGRDLSVFRIPNDEIQDSLGLEARAGLRFSLTSIPDAKSTYGMLRSEKLETVNEWARRAHKTQSDNVTLRKNQQTDGYKEVTIADEQAMDLYRKQSQYRYIRHINWLPTQEDSLDPKGLQVWLLGAVYGVDQMSSNKRGMPRLFPAADDESDWGNPTELMLKAITPKITSRSDPDELALRQGEISPLEFVERAVTASPDSQWLNLFWDMQKAFRAEDSEQFNKAVAAFQAAIGETPLSVENRFSVEVFMNRFQPFMQCIVLSILALVLVIGSWFGWREPLLRAALMLACLSLFVHTAGLGARMYLDGRPLVFVTNLYSSAVFVGWIAIITGLLLERIYRNSIGLTVACIISFLSLIIAQNLDAAGDGGDNLEVLRAVLDTNFWLATHVTTVAIGYAATFVAGGLGIAYLFLGIFTPALDKDLSKILSRMIYGVLCGALTLSFIGTVLGGIWADQSWGRFWGWDTKENGALIIVMWNAIVLHARWGGMVRQRGMATMAVFGNIVTSWSWFGVNELNVGLHSYGGGSGDSSGFKMLLLFWGSQFAIMALGAFWPEKSWNSYDAMTQNPPKRRGGKRIKNASPA